MKVNELKGVGVALTSNGDPNPLVAYKDASGAFILYRNNDEFGMQMMLGFEEVEFMEIDSDMANSFVSFLADLDFQIAGIQGIAMIDGGFLLIKDFDCGECGTVGKCIDPTQYRPLDNYVDCGEFEDFSGCEYFDELMNYF